MVRNPDTGAGPRRTMEAGTKGQRSGCLSKAVPGGPKRTGTTGRCMDHTFQDPPKGLSDLCTHVAPCGSYSPRGRGTDSPALTPIGHSEQTGSCLQPNLQLAIGCVRRVSHTPLSQEVALPPTYPPTLSLSLSCSAKGCFLQKALLDHLGKDNLPYHCFLI